METKNFRFVRLDSDMPAANESLVANEVRVHYRLLGDRQAADHAAADYSLLSPDERHRAARFVFMAHRVRYVASHALLRRTLSQFAPVPPAAWRFITDTLGKPALAADFAWTNLLFNLSRTKGLVACGVSSTGDVGIDTEWIDPAVDDDAIARHFFSALEIAALAKCTNADRQSKFIELWTLREAYVKARGTGLSDALHYFRGVLDDGTSSQVDVRIASDELTRFALCAPSPWHRIAVAMCERRGVAGHLERAALHPHRPARLRDRPLKAATVDPMEER